MRISAVLLVTFCLIFYLANGRPHPEVDCLAAPYVAWSMVKNGSCDIRSFEEVHPLRGIHIREMSDGSMISMRSPGASLPILPLVTPMILCGMDTPSSMTMMQLGKIASACCVAISTLLIFLTVRQLSASGAWPAAILFGFGTCLASVASQASWMHAPATLWLCLALYSATRPNNESTRWTLLFGLSLGMATFVRSNLAFFAIASGMSLLYQRQFKRAFLLALAGSLPVMWLMYFNAYYFGSPFLGGYAVDNWDSHPPLAIGLAGLLIAPSRGLFIYSPAILFAGCGIVRLLRDREMKPANRTLMWCWLGAAMATILLFARWHDWRGGWCYGPRFLCEIMPIMCVLFGMGYAHLRSWGTRRAAELLVACSVVIHFAGIYGHGAYVDWNWRHHHPGDQGLCLFSTQDTQIEAHLRSLVNRLAGMKDRQHPGTYNISQAEMPHDVRRQ